MNEKCLRVMSFGRISKSQPVDVSKRPWFGRYGRGNGLGFPNAIYFVNFTFSVVVPELANVQKAFPGGGLDRGNVFPIQVPDIRMPQGRQRFAFRIERVNERSAAGIIVRPENILLTF